MRVSGATSQDLRDDGMWMQLEEMGERPDLLRDPFLDDEMLEARIAALLEQDEDDDDDVGEPEEGDA